MARPGLRLALILQFLELTVFAALPNGALHSYFLRPAGL